MTPAVRCGSDSRKMEASREVKKEPAALLSAGKEGGRLVKRKRVGSESEQNHKRSHGASSRPSKPKSVKDVNSTAGKRKRASSTATEDIDPADESAMNAAQALFELFGGSGTSPKESPDRKSCNADGVKWAGKKSRSCRSSLKKADDSCACKVSSSSTTSATVTDIPEVLDSSASHNHHVAVNMETVNLEDESEADADAKSTDMSPCGGFGFDRCHRLLSQSSVESTLLDSRGESPSSPLRVLRPEVPLLPKLEEEMMLQFGFPRQTPVRPVVKPSILRKPKAEETFVVESDELKEVKIALNKVQRRKPRGASGTPTLLLQGDSVLDVPITSAAAVQLKECIEENKLQVPITLNLFEPVKPEPGSRSVKLEPGREQLYQTGSFTQGRLRTALSEAEKEARRLRRVQANRESARQTIRRKQVLCEELARKAGELQTEKESLAQSLEQKTKELRNHQELNRHLNDQILLQAAGSAEAPLHSSTRASNIVTSSPTMPPSGGAGMQAGMSLIPYWWAFAVAQMAAATSQSPSQMPAACEPGMVAPGGAAPDMNTVIAATVAAFNSGAGMNANVWMNMMGNMAQGNKLSGMVAEDQSSQQPAAVRPTPASESTPSPLKPAAAAASIAMAAASAQPLARSQSLTRNGYPLSPMKSGTFDPMLSRSPMNGNSMSMKTNPKGKYQTSNGPLIRSSSGMSQMTHHVTQMTSADGTSTALSLGLATQQQQRKPTSSASNLRFFPTIGNGVQGFLGPRVGGTYQSEAAALATEARRRRRELKRTKSLQTQLQQEKKLASVKSL